MTSQTYSTAPGQIALSLAKIEQTKALITKALDYGHKAEADMHRRTLDADLRRHAALTIGA